MEGNRTVRSMSPTTIQHTGHINEVIPLQIEFCFTEALRISLFASTESWPPLRPTKRPIQKALCALLRFQARNHPLNFN